MEQGGLDQTSMRHILAGFDSDDDDEEGSVNSFLEEMRKEQKEKEESKVKFMERSGGLGVIESGTSMKFHAEGD